MVELTYHEKLLLDTLKSGPRHDHDRAAERVLVNSGLAERFGVGQIRITKAGRVYPRRIIPRELPMAERVNRYQHNITIMRSEGWRIGPPLIDTLDPTDIRAWFEDGDRQIARLERAILALAKLPADTELPSPFITAEV